jgi:hypothetical protein
MDTIDQFAERYRVKLRLDSCGEKIIPGRQWQADMPKRIPKRQEHRCHIYDHGDGKHFGVCLMFETKKQWSYAKKKLVAAGFTMCQDGDTEGTALFDAANEQQARLALDIARVRTAYSRQLTPEQRQAASGRMTAIRHRIHLSRPRVE